MKKKIQNEASEVNELDCQYYTIWTWL